MCNHESVTCSFFCFLPCRVGSCAPCPVPPLSLSAHCRLYPLIDVVRPLLVTGAESTRGLLGYVRRLSAACRALSSKRPLLALRSASLIFSEWQLNNRTRYCFRCFSCQIPSCAASVIHAFALNSQIKSEQHDAISGCCSPTGKRKGLPRTDVVLP